MQVTAPGCCGMRRVDEDGCCVACGRDFFDPDTGEERGDGSRVANAVLADTSFEMLEVLEWIAQMQSLNDLGDIMPRLNAAIAKAKGEVQGG